MSDKVLQSFSDGDGDGDPGQGNREGLPLPYTDRPAKPLYGELAGARSRGNPSRLPWRRGALVVLALILLAVALRILLVSLGWPPTNSDEATMGLMARHIAYNGEHPVFFYGQNYMGAIEAYLGAMFFHLFGPSLLALRLSVISLTALFLFSIYLLTRTLYTGRFALFMLALLCLGSNYMFLRETYATGGSTQTLLFGSLSFLLAALLGVSYNPEAAPRQRWLRNAGYGGYGLVIGLGLWSDWVVLPFFALSAVLLLWFCWRDWRSLAPVCLLLGLALGAFPLISYNVVAPPSQDSLNTLLELFHGSQVQQAHTLAKLVQGIKATIQVSVPTATGSPFCPAPAVDYAVDLSSKQSASCMTLNTLWGLGYLLLWLLSALLTSRALWRVRKQRGERREMVLLAARLCMLAGAGLAIVAYAVSSAPLGMPQSHARYLIGLLIVTPAIIWPLWQGFSLTTWLLPRARFRVIASRPPRGRPPQGGPLHVAAPLVGVGLLGLVAASFLLGTALTFSDVPSAQAADQQQSALINGLLGNGVTRIYTDYWTCDRVAFMSQERIICVVLDNNLQPTHNRNPHAYGIVSADPHAAYVFTVNSIQSQTLEQRLQAAGTAGMYRKFVVAGYVVYEPT